MSQSVWIDVFFWAFAAVAGYSGWRVFRTDSMVRASFLLLTSLVGSGAIMLLLAAEYLGLALIFMMALEMTVMALFMVAFMMNPGGLNPMVMVHQHRVAVVAGVATFLGLASVGVFADFPHRPLVSAEGTIEALGIELLGDSMLVFESAGVTLLATMIGAVALSSHRSRHGVGDVGSVPPPLNPDESARHAEEQEPAPTGHAHGHASGGSS